MFRLINNIKTAMLLGLLMGLFLIVGNAIAGKTGLIAALIFGGGMNIFAYLFSDKIALLGMGARYVSPQEAPEIYQMVNELASKARIPTPKVYIAPTAVPNAFATGRSPRHAAICLTQGIIEMLEPEELKAVIGHELAHIKHYDMLISTIAATIAGAISALGYLLWFMPLGSSDDDAPNPLLALVMIIIAPIAAALIQLAISRKREFVADNYSAELMQDPYPLAYALKKLYLANQRMPLRLANPAQQGLFIVQPLTTDSIAKLFSTHPPIEERIKALIGSRRI